MTPRRRRAPAATRANVFRTRASIATVRYLAAEAGFNWQINSQWLVGIETDYQWADFSGSGISTFNLAKIGTTNMVSSEKVESFGTLRIRMGAIPIPAVLLYGTGGFAYGYVSDSLQRGCSSDCARHARRRIFIFVHRRHSVLRRLVRKKWK